MSPVSKVGSHVSVLDIHRVRFCSEASNLNTVGIPGGF